MQALALLALVVSVSVPPPDRVRLVDRNQADAVRRALVGASSRLAGGECQGLLVDFRDGAGRTLRENVEARGQTATAVLGETFYYDGDRLPNCLENPGVLAFTAPRSRVVFVCGARFHSQWRRNPSVGEILLIHEALHSLGLGEDPPSSDEITRRVAWSCPR